MPALMGPSIGMLLKRHAGSDAVVVDFIKPGGLADQSGKVTVGDIIVAVNGVDVRSLPLPNICELMANRNHKASGISPVPATSQVHACTSNVSF
jgi:C-terminal processing protease CtpA/Prc